MVKVTPPAQFVVKAVAENKFFVFPQSGLRGFSAYQLAVQNGFEGTVTEWLASLAGEAGKSIEMDIRPDGLYFRQEAGSWQLFVTKEEIAGEDGKSVELQKTATHIQWRQVGGAWGNLVALADLKGDAGPNEVTTDTSTNLSGLLLGAGANSKISAATPAQAQQLVIQTLSNFDRRNLSGLTAPYRVYDLDWKADFLWDGGQWEQLTTPLVSDSQMLMLPNPEVGYKVFNTTWNSEHVWVGFWQGVRSVVKPSSTQVVSNIVPTNNNDPHLLLPLTAGVWQVQLKLITNNSPGGWRFRFAGPELTTWATTTNIGNAAGAVLTRSGSAISNSPSTSGGNNASLNIELIWEANTNGTLQLQWAQSAANASPAIIYENTHFTAIRIK